MRRTLLTLVLLALLPLATSPRAATAPPRADTATDFDWPTGEPVPVLRPFAPPQNRWDAGHRGADLAFAAGSDVLAAGAGRVAFAGPVGGKPVVAIEHPGGLRTTYEPVAASVKRGAAVRAGEPIGVLQPGHCAPIDCLHFGAKFGTGRGEQYIDPLSLFAPLRYRLVPLGGLAAG